MRKVLLVDDDDYIRLRLKRMKIWGESSGYMIVGEAEDGHQALEVLSREYVDLVISDIRMPKVNGIELLEKIVARRLAACVVFLSEHSEFAYAKQGLVLGAFDYLVKPVGELDLRTLLERVDKRLQTSAARSGSAGIGVRLGAITKTDMARLKEYLLSGDARLTEVAQALVDKVLDAHGGDPGKVIVALNGFLADLTQSLRDDNPWLDAFVDSHQLAELVLIQENIAPMIRQKYIASLQVLSQTVAPFVPLQQYGSTIIKTQQYIMQHIDETITLTMLSDALFVNRTHLSEVFKKKTGLTLAAYLSGMKMQRAKYVLTSTDMTIAEVAELLGYKDVEYFSRLFKRRTGFSPSDYRRQFARASPRKPEYFRG